jgi:hypothetical protein
MFKTSPDDLIITLDTAPMPTARTVAAIDWNGGYRRAVQSEQAAQDLILTPRDRWSLTTITTLRPSSGGGWRDGLVLQGLRCCTAATVLLSRCVAHQTMHAVGLGWRCKQQIGARVGRRAHMGRLPMRGITTRVPTTSRSSHPMFTAPQQCYLGLRSMGSRHYCVTALSNTARVVFLPGGTDVHAAHVKSADSACRGRDQHIEATWLWDQVSAADW